MKGIQNNGLDKLPIPQWVPTVSLLGKLGNYQSDFIRQFPLCLLPPPPPPPFKISVFWRKSKIPKNSNWIFKKTTSRNISMGILRHEVQGRGEDTELAS